MNRRDEAGAASLLVVTCLMVLLLIGAALGVVAALVRSHRSAQAAADLAALAGATAVQRGDDGCAAAGVIAGRNDSVLVSCRLEGEDVLVSVEVGGPHWLGQTADPVAEARAGPGQG